MNQRDALFFISLLLICSKSFSEYRVFLLNIKNRTTGQVQLVPSTLDPEQYKSLFPQLNADLAYSETWLCKGNTSNYKPLCPNPTKPLPPVDSTEPAGSSSMPPQ